MKPIEIRYEDLLSILMRAKNGFKLDYEYYRVEKDLKRVKKLESIIKEITESTTIDFIIMETPF